MLKNQYFFCRDPALGYNLNSLFEQLLRFKNRFRSLRKLHHSFLIVYHYFFLGQQLFQPFKVQKIFFICYFSSGSEAGKQDPCREVPGVLRAHTKGPKTGHHLPDDDDIDHVSDDQHFSTQVNQIFNSTTELKINMNIFRCLTRQSEQCSGLNQLGRDKENARSCKM